MTGVSLQIFLRQNTSQILQIFFVVNSVCLANTNFSDKWRCFQAVNFTRSNLNWFPGSSRLVYHKSEITFPPKILYSFTLYQYFNLATFVYLTICKWSRRNLVTLYRKLPKIVFFGQNGKFQCQFSHLSGWVRLIRPHAKKNTFFKRSFEPLLTFLWFPEVEFENWNFVTNFH